MPNETRKLGTVAPMPQSGGFSSSTRSTHHAGPGREEPLVEREPRDPRGDEPRPPGGCVEDVSRSCSARPARASRRAARRRAGRTRSRAGGGSSGSSPCRSTSAPAVATPVTRTISSACGARGNAFCSDIAAEYAFANASSVSVTRSAKSATIAAKPPATTAAGSAAGSPRPRESTSTAPSASSQASSVK